MQMLCAPNRTAPRVDHGNDGALILMRCVRGADEECFPSSPGGAAAFAESLGEASACGALSRACVHEPSTGCGHIGLGAAYYLRDTGLLDVLRRQDKHTWVIRQDFFDSDIVGLWDWLCVPAWEPRTVQTAASRRGATASLWPLGVFTFRHVSTPRSGRGPAMRWCTASRSRSVTRVRHKQQPHGATSHHTPSHLWPGWRAHRHTRPPLHAPATTIAGGTTTPNSPWRGASCWSSTCRPTTT